MIDLANCTIKQISRLDLFLMSLNLFHLFYSCNTQNISYIISSNQTIIYCKQRFKEYDYYIENKFGGFKCYILEWNV